MFVPLTTTYHPLRAHMAAGILEEHGIAAWVRGDVTSSSYGTFATGGCQVMVEEEDAEEAATVLNTLPPPPPADPEGSQREPPPLPAREREGLSLEKAIGTGLAQGAVYLPLLVGAMLVLQTVILALREPSAGHTVVSRDASPAGVLYAMLYCIVAGGILGGIVGVVTWLFSNYRRGGISGTIFVTAVAVFLVAPGPVVALLFGQLSRLLDLFLIPA